MAKMQANKPDVIAFNGYALQYKDNPVPVKRGETVRMYVLNAGPSIWSAFHVIGTVFDTAHTDNGIAHDVQTINLAPSQGGWADFTLDAEGAYPFVTHAFGDAVKGAIGVLKTAHAPAAAGHDMGGSHAMPAASAQGDAAPAVGDVNVTLGDMWVKADTPTVKAGKVSFAVKNEGHCPRPRDRADAGQAERRNARRQRTGRQGQGARGRRVRDRQLGSQARLV
jgi:FtsP/CotA-like multicopper oxidase with cupredoxin domain